MSDIDLDSLQAKAEASAETSPREWYSPAHTAFTDASGPDVVLALIARVRNAESEVQAIREMHPPSLGTWDVDRLISMGAELVRSRAAIQAVLAIHPPPGKSCCDALENGPCVTALAAGFVVDRADR